ncbi:FmdB family transcriptional regulator [Microbispora hainanensis]|uniref:FmdB family transcriptional regulator n=1 Tax=Microbispora hainanensis TaxID=568844 RepID=A0ABZ1SPP1_9ACTN|nr:MULTISPECIES: FmdB family zinc ribbon protein [Microbispora]NJP29711.1 FmdB family transcriptional regulator [Microbispora sp. CL1-1]TQS04414.1 FmdB family transcriptional regulator [Microbispora sp. SCL1-1]
MPTYQYACTACGEQLEAVQKFSDDPLTECPACQGKLRKVFSAVGIVFKGSGFYRTDSRSSSSSTTTATTTTTSSKSSGDSGKKEPATSTSSSSSSSSSASSSSTSSSGSTAAA